MPVRTPSTRGSRARVRPTVPGRVPGSTTIHIGGGASGPRPLSPRRLAKAKAKLAHAANGHASMAAQHRAAAASATGDEAATLLRMAAAHDKAVEDFAKKSAALK